MLGHEITFAYCRTPGSDIPCRKIFDCWWETFDITAFIKKYYDKETLQMLTAPPQPKTSSLLDLIEQARQRCSKANEE